MKCRNYFSRKCSLFLCRFFFESQPSGQWPNALKIRDLVNDIICEAYSICPIIRRTVVKVYSDKY